MTLRGLADRAALRADLVKLERALLRGSVRGLAGAVVALLVALAGLATFEPLAPLGEEARIVSVALAASLGITGIALGIARGLRRRATRLEAAFALDRSLGLGGELPAALELEASLAAPSAPGEAGRGFASVAVASALEKARAVDLARAIPRTPPPESAAAPWLLGATVALAFVVVSRPAPHEPEPPASRLERRSPAEMRDVARAAEVLARAAHDLSFQARETEGELEAPGPANRAVEELERQARALARGTHTRQGALAGIAAARGRVEASRLEGLGDALEGARAALAEAPALAGLARALEDGEARAIRDQAHALAERLRANTLTDDAQAQIASAAARAERALEGASGGTGAKSALERLAKTLDQGASPDAKAQAMGAAGDELARARSQAGADQVAQRGLDALDQARDAAKGDRRDGRATPGEGGKPTGKPGRSHEPPGATGEGGLARKGTEPSSPRPGDGAGDQGGSEKREGSNPGSGRGADERAGKREDPAGSGIGGHVAGKGGTNEQDESGKSRSPEEQPGGPPSTLAGLLGSRGASAVFAVRGIARGEEPTRRERDVIQDYRRSEEEALERELVPLDRRRLVERYFEAIAGDGATASGGVH